MKTKELSLVSVVEQASRQVTSYGSSTLLLAHMPFDRLNIYNMGDSKLVVFREDRGGY